MGPRSHERGNAPSAPSTSSERVCQSFNGAAFSRTRKHCALLHVQVRPWTTAGFNGAAFSRTRKRPKRVAF